MGSGIIDISIGMILRRLLYRFAFKEVIYWWLTCFRSAKFSERREFNTANLNTGQPEFNVNCLNAVSIHSYGGPSAGRAGRRGSDERGFLSLRIEQSESDLTPTGLAQLLRRPLLYM
jgi:hypothetical protein